MNTLNQLMKKLALLDYLLMSDYGRELVDSVSYDKVKAIKFLDDNCREGWRDR